MAQGENQVAEVKMYRDSRGERRDGCTKSRPECSEGNRDERERDGRLKGLLTQRAFSGQKGGKKKRVIVLTGARRKNRACSETPRSCEANSPENGPQSSQSLSH